MFLWTIFLGPPQVKNFLFGPSYLLSLTPLAYIIEDNLGKFMPFYRNNLQRWMEIISSQLNVQHPLVENFIMFLSRRRKRNIVNKKLMQKIQSKDISTPYIEEGKLMNNSEFAIYTHDFGLSNPMSLSSSIKQKMFVLYLGIDEYTSSKAKITEALIFCRRQFIKKDSLESVLRQLIDLLFIKIKLFIKEKNSSSI